MTKDPIPLTVVGGYLGSGKTTLVNHLLRNAGGRRLAVLVNDFGALDIDAQLIEAGEDNVISLANGCICCAIGDSLVSALMRLGRRPERPDHLVIETSGIADPARVAQIGLAGRSFALEAVVVLVDPLEIRERADDAFVGEMVRRQLAAGDLLVLNKTDLVDAPTRAAVRAWLRDVAPDVPVMECAQAAVPPDLLLAGRPRAGAAADPPKEGEADHLYGLTTRSYASRAPLDRVKLQDALARLPEGVLRVKGLVRPAAPGDAPLVVNKVGRRVTVAPAPPTLRGLKDTQLVFIGTREAIAALDTDIAALLHEASEPRDPDRSNRA